MPPVKGVTAKSSRWAFVIDCENYDADLVYTALASQNITAAVSPLHDLDPWERPDIYKYMLSRSRSRDGVLFFYDEAFDASNGFLYKEAIQRTDLPLYACWSVGNGRASDESYAGDSVFFPLDPSGLWHVCTLPALGEVKRPHKHVQMYFPANPIPWSTAFNRLEMGGIREEMLYYIEPVNNWEGLLRYYPHLDNPEKAQYKASDVRSFYGFDLSPLYRKSEAGKVAEFELVYAMVRSMGSERATLLSVTDALVRGGKPEIARAISSRSGYWNTIIGDMKVDAQTAAIERKRNESQIQSLVEKLESVG